MSGITLSAGVRQNLLTLQNTADMLNTTNNRLATGNKVNSAVDNPNSYFTAAGLNNRASDLSTLQDSMGLAVQTINAASTGIDAISKLVSQAKSTANQALQADYHSANLALDVTATDYSASGASKTLTIKIGTNASTSVTLTQNITSAGVLKTALSAAGISGLSVSTSGTAVKLTVASGENVTVSGTATGSGQAIAGSTLASTDGISDRATYIAQYNNLLSQIDQQAGDSSFNGVNLLQSGTTLSVVFNEKGSSKLDISGKDVSSTGLGLSSVSDWTTKDKINATISKLDSATTTLRAQSTAFGNNLSVVQNRQTFTKSLISTLQTGASNLTLADSNEEAANLLALQTRQSLATTSLSISNQANQSITKLF